MRLNISETPYESWYHFRVFWSTQVEEIMICYGVQRFCWDYHALMQCSTRYIYSPCEHFLSYCPIGVCVTTHLTRQHTHTLLRDNHHSMKIYKYLVRHSARYCWLISTVRIYCATSHISQPIRSRCCLCFDNLGKTVSGCSIGGIASFLPHSPCRI